MPNLWSRRGFVRAAGSLGTLTGAAALGITSAAPATAAVRPRENTDWSVAVVESTMARFPNASDVGDWEYTQGLYMYGQHLLYERTGDPRYLAYIRQWVDGIVSDNGDIDYPLESLDSFRSGTVLLKLYAETGAEKYRLAADNIRRRLDSYPRTSDGAFTHDTTDRRHQLWADGTYMVLPFLAGYGKQFGESEYANDEVTSNLLIYASHLLAPSGLLYHAYDEAGEQSWADPVTHHSPEIWCRAVGWYCMTCVDVLDILPANHPNRPRIIGLVRTLAQALARYQDRASGRWFQVVDKGTVTGNWTETSSSAMFTYTLAKAVQRGYLPARYGQVAKKGYRGVLDKASVGEDGLTNVTDICIGTGVGDLAWYFARPRATNDMHGLGAFLIMNEQLIGF